MHERNCSFWRLFDEVSVHSRTNCEKFSRSLTKQRFGHCQQLPLRTELCFSVNSNWIFNLLWLTFLGLPDSLHFHPAWVEPAWMLPEEWKAWNWEQLNLISIRSTSTNQQPNTTSKLTAELYPLFDLWPKQYENPILFLVKQSK